MSIEHMRVGSALRFHSSLKKVDREAVVELATVIFSGQAFTALGSARDEERGVLVGYPVRGMLCQWDGTPIASLFVTGHARGFGGARLTCWTCTYRGRRYHGRNAGEHMVLRMRAGRAVQES